MLDTEWIAKKYNFNKLQIIEQLGGLSSINYSAIADNNRELIIKIYQNIALDKVLLITNVNRNIADLLDIIPEPLLTIDGEIVLNINSHYVVVFLKIVGNNLLCNEFDENALLETTKYLAKFHNLVLPKNVIIPSTISLLRTPELVYQQAQSLLIKIQNNIKENHINNLTKKLMNLKLDIVNNFINFHEIGESISNYQFLIHGDFHHENILFNNGNLVGIIDFEHVHYGHPIEDLMHFIYIVCCGNGFSEINLKKSQFFLQSYLKHINLLPEQIYIAIDLYIYNSASSFFLENKLCDSSSNDLITLIMRDLSNLTYFINNKNEFIQKLLSL